MVVALFPGGMQWMRFPDLGGAGHHGFKPDPQPNVKNIFYVPGSHSAALKDHHWSEIADFIIGGEWPSTILERRLPYRDDRWGGFVGAIGRAPGLALLGVSVFSLAIISGLVWGLSAISVSALIVGLPLLTILVARVLTRL
jgi:hypothetical protein